MTLRTYPHPTEARQFYAPDVEPVVDAGVPILHISGLDNYAQSHPNHHVRPAATQRTARSSSGSAPDGSSYLGYDFRHAYVPGSPLTGAGQTVGLFRWTGTMSGHLEYESQAGITPHVPMQNVLLDGLTGTPRRRRGGRSVPGHRNGHRHGSGIDQVVVFEGNSWDDIVNSMAANSGIKQFGCSWGFDGTVDATLENDFQLMAAQGQSFYLASGDGDAFTGALEGPDDTTNITVVGGTTLTMIGSARPMPRNRFGIGVTRRPAVVHWPGYWGSSGGISTVNAIPPYQRDLNMVASRGSTTMRNVPDVALTADSVWVIYLMA